MREVNYNDPSSWDEDDKTWLRDRVDRVPPEHRHHLEISFVLAPAQAAESVEIDRLRAFLNANFPDEMKATEIGETPVGVAIKLLSDEFETVDPSEVSAEDVVEADNDTYDQWKVSELKEEIDNRNTTPGRTNPIVPVSDKKADLIRALRNDDYATSTAK